MDQGTNQNSVGRSIRLSAWIGAAFALVVLTILGLNHAFALMSQKSNRDFFVGLAIIAVLIAVYIPLAVYTYRAMTRKSESGVTMTHPYKLAGRAPQEAQEEHDGKT